MFETFNVEVFRINLPLNFVFEQNVSCEVEHEQTK